MQKKLVIGNNTYDVIELNASFPIDFYRETGKDIFKIETLVQDNPIEVYESFLHLAYFLTGKQKGFDEFIQDFTPGDLANAYTDIYSIYNAVSQPTVEAKGEKK